MNVPAAQLTFFCELDSGRLSDLFTEPKVMDFLVNTRSAVSLGILDLSDQRANIVQELNQAGVPVTAWLLLPKEEGYWFNLDNAPQAVARYARFQEWTSRHDLKWARIGLDIEPDLQSIQSISKKRWAGARKLFNQAFRASRLRDGARIYHELINCIHASGYLVEAYHFPFLIDERIAQSTILQRLSGLVDLPEVDHEAFMLYSSFTRPWGQGMLWSYGPESEVIAVGSTGGGVELDGVLDIPPLNWAELQTDLLLANQHTPFIYIFSLEGCVGQNFLPLLADFDWHQPVQVPYRAAQKAEEVRKTLRRALWVLSRPALILFGLALVASSLTLLIRKKRS